jgi:hypothetical protein
MLHHGDNLGQQIYGTHFVEVAVGAYSLAEWDMKVECCHRDGRVIIDKDTKILTIVDRLLVKILPLHLVKRLSK